jgi:hypothetical protein
LTGVARLFPAPAALSPPLGSSSTATAVVLLTACPVARRMHASAWSSRGFLDAWMLTSLTWPHHGLPPGLLPGGARADRAASSTAGASGTAHCCDGSGARMVERHDDDTTRRTETNECLELRSQRICDRSGGSATCGPTNGRDAGNNPAVHGYSSVAVSISWVGRRRRRVVSRPAAIRLLPVGLSRPPMSSPEAFRLSPMAPKDGVACADEGISAFAVLPRPSGARSTAVDHVTDGARGSPRGRLATQRSS